MKNILNGFLELKKFGVIHRDLKPANILIHKNIYKIAGELLLFNNFRFWICKNC